MKVRDAVSPEQLRRLREIGREARTPFPELAQIALRLERALWDKGELLWLLRNEAARRDAELSYGPVSERLAAARQDDIAEFLLEEDEVELVSTSVVHTSRQHRIAIDEGNDPTPAAVDKRSERGRRVGADRATVYRLPSSFARLYAWLRPFVEPTLVDPQPRDFAYIASVARMTDTTSQKLLEAYHVIADVLSRARERGAVVVIHDTKWTEKPRYKRLADELAAGRKRQTVATRPGQDVYAKHSRVVSTGTGSPEEIAAAVNHAEGITNLDTDDLQRLQRPRELDPLELAVVVDEVLRESKITVSELRGSGRAARLAQPRRRIIVTVGGRASAADIGRAIGRSPAYVRRVRQEEGIGN